MNENKENKSEKNKEIKLVGVSPITPHNRAVLEAGKALLVDSINVGRDFCKFMISLSTGAIPIYLGLIKLALPDDYSPSLLQWIITIIPAVLFLVTTVIFVFGYYPKVGRFSLDIIEEIEKERTNTIQRRKILTWIGFGIFLFSTLTAIVILFMILWVTRSNNQITTHWWHPWP